MKRTDEGQDPGADRQDARENRRALEHGSSNSTADYAVEGRPNPEDRFIDAPYARPAKPLAPDEKPDQLADKVAQTKDAEEARTDESVEESFPASDPPSFQPKRDGS